MREKKGWHQSKDEPVPSGHGVKDRASAYTSEQVGFDSSRAKAGRRKPSMIIAIFGDSKKVLLIIIAQGKGKKI